MVQEKSSRVNQNRVFQTKTRKMVCTIGEIAGQILKAITRETIIHIGLLNISNFLAETPNP